MISKYNERITITINKNLLFALDMKRGYKSRTNYIQDLIAKDISGDLDIKKKKMLR